MKFEITNIDWDTDDATEGGYVSKSSLNLPVELIVEADDKEAAVDAASEEVGFCIKECSVTAVEKTQTPGTNKTKFAIVSAPTNFIPMLEEMRYASAIILPQWKKDIVLTLTSAGHCYLTLKISQKDHPDVNILALNRECKVWATDIHLWSTSNIEHWAVTKEDGAWQLALGLFFRKPEDLRHFTRGVSALFVSGKQIEVLRCTLEHYKVLGSFFEFVQYYDLRTMGTLTFGEEGLVGELIITNYIGGNSKKCYQKTIKGYGPEPLDVLQGLYKGLKENNGSVNWYLLDEFYDIEEGHFHDTCEKVSYVADFTEDQTDLVKGNMIRSLHEEDEAENIIVTV